MLRTIVVLLAWTPVAATSDGVVGINQAAAIAGGVTPGDAPGLPVSINAPGSYRLTGDLVTEDSSTDVIRINADDVTVDLNGFALIGPNTCSGDPGNVFFPTLTCTEIGLNNGLNGGDHARIRVLNGRVVGMGWQGLTVGEQSRVERVTAKHNRSNGIRTGSWSIVSDSNVSWNGGDGISAGGDSVVTGNTANFNGEDGIISGGGVITENTVYSNNDDGIEHSGRAAVVARNTTKRNAEFGFVLVGSTVVTATTTTSNFLGGVAAGPTTMVGNTAAGNTRNAIQVQSAALIADNTVHRNFSRGIVCVAGSACNVQRNAIYDNDWYGLEATSFSGYAGNVFDANKGGNSEPQVNGGVPMGTNVCAGDTTCP